MAPVSILETNLPCCEAEIGHAPWTHPGFVCFFHFYQENGYDNSSNSTLTMVYIHR